MNDHQCTPKTCLYGGGHHMIAVEDDHKVKDIKYKRVLKSIAICRVCQKTHKYVACYGYKGEFLELMVPVAAEEYSKLLRRKFHLLKGLEPDDVRRKEVERAVQHTHGLH